MKRAKTGPEMAVDIEETIEQLKAGTLNHETAQGHAALAREQLRIKKLQLDILRQYGGKPTEEMLNWVGFTPEKS